MYRFLLLFVFSTCIVNAQELKLIKATRQAVKSSIDPSTTVSYSILIKKEKCFNWSIDSVIDVYRNAKVDFRIARVTKGSNAKVVYSQLKKYSKKDKGIYELSFSAIKHHESGKPGTPMNLRVPADDFTQGTIIYYSAKKNKKQLAVETFDNLE